MYANSFKNVFAESTDKLWNPETLNGIHFNGQNTCACGIDWLKNTGILCRVKLNVKSADKCF